MITINLLPQEYRKAERTPIVLFLPLIIGMICVLSAGAVAGYVRFAVLADVRGQRELLDTTLAEKRPRIAYCDSLQKEEAEYRKQADTILNIASGRILMTKRLDELNDLIAEGDAGQHGGYVVWLKELSTKPPREAPGKGKSKEPKSGGTLEFKGLALADRSPLQDFNRFHRSIKDSAMFQDGYIGMNDPKGSATDFDDDMEPAKGWNFDLSLSLRDPSERLKQMEEAAKLQAKIDASGASKKRKGR